jgi:acetylornithine deacetylase/succinyl-diaminopimelate desuccinylase-like protein
MVMLMLKRANVSLDRDVIFLEAGEEGTTRVGIEYPERFLAQLKNVINDPSVDAVFNGWPPTTTGKPRNGGESRIDSEAFKVAEAAIAKHYQATTLPTMSTGASDMAFLRAKGMQCYGVGPATDTEDGPKGFGAHSDEERILEAELHRFVRFHWDIVMNMAGAAASRRSARGAPPP